MSDSAGDFGVVWGKVVARSWSDDEFKSKLLDDPRDVLSEAGYSVPEGVELSISDSGPDRMHLVIPPAPEGFDSEIGDESLETMSGGYCTICCCMPPSQVG